MKKVSLDTLNDVRYCLFAKVFNFESISDLSHEEYMVYSDAYFAIQRLYDHLRENGEVGL